MKDKFLLEILSILEEDTNNESLDLSEGDLLLRDILFEDSVFLQESSSNKDIKAIEKNVKEYESFKKSKIDPLFKIWDNFSTLLEKTKPKKRLFSGDTSKVTYKVDPGLHFGHTMEISGQVPNNDDPNPMSKTSQNKYKNDLGQFSKDYKGNGRVEENETTHKEFQRRFKSFTFEGMNLLDKTSYFTKAKERSKSRDTNYWVGTEKRTKRVEPDSEQIEELEYYTKFNLDQVKVLYPYFKKVTDQVITKEVIEQLKNLGK